MTTSEEPFSRVLVVVANYDFSSNAALLKKSFSGRFRTLLIDASSPERPEGTDITIPNSYYQGLWNAAVSEAIESGAEWLFFVASDVQFLDFESLFAVLQGVLERPDIGIYTPSLRRDSRLSFSNCFNRGTAGLRECALIEGFCFLARTGILEELYPVPADNTYGWGVDRMAARVAYGQNRKLVVDDRVKIFHPEARQEHAIPADRAQTRGVEYVQQAMNVLDPDESNIHEWVNTAKTDIDARGGMLDGQFFRSLDLGCGDSPGNYFAAREVYGVSADPSLAAKNSHIMTADLAVEAIPAPDSSFDYMTAFNYLGDVLRPDYARDQPNPLVELMNEIWRVLKPGGIFLCVTQAVESTHVPAGFITEETFTRDFDDHQRRAARYGFKGFFEVEHQARKPGGELTTWLRAVRKS